MYLRYQIELILYSTSDSRYTTTRSVFRKLFINITNYVMQNAVYNPLSTFQQFFCALKYKYNSSLSHVNVVPHSVIESSPICKVISDVIDIRDVIKTCNIMNELEVREFIKSLWIETLP